MAQHVKILAVLHLVFGGIGVLIACLILMLFGGIAGVVGMNANDADAWIAAPILIAIGSFVFFVIAVLSVPRVICGVGLLSFRPWARVLEVIISAISLLDMPFGTALGGYGLWVLLADQSQPLFQAGSPAR